MDPSPTLHPGSEELEHLSAPQIRRIQTLPDDHRLVRMRGRAPIVRRPDGELLAHPPERAARARAPGGAGALLSARSRIGRAAVDFPSRGRRYPPGDRRVPAGVPHR